MTYYVSHKYNDIKDIDRAKETVRELQENDWINCYICPILTVDACWEDMPVDENIIIEVHRDILCLCDEMIVASEIDNYVQADIDLAKQIGMECFFL